VGAPLGGWIGDTFDWRAAFLVQSPVLVFAFALLFLKVREPAFILAAQTSSSMGAKLKRIDYAGSLSLLLALLSFLVGMNAKNAREWSDVRVWGFISAGSVSLTSLRDALTESRV
jgi:predicted MFS family arabinose efflux permease